MLMLRVMSLSGQVGQPSIDARRIKQTVLESKRIKNVLGVEASVSDVDCAPAAPQTLTRPPCPTCGCTWSAEGFYVGCAECKSCKRNRSRRNRVLSARKIALAERVIDALVSLAEQGWPPDLQIAPQGQRALVAAAQSIEQLVPCTAEKPEGQQPSQMAAAAARCRALPGPALLAGPAGNQSDLE